LFCNKNGDSKTEKGQNSTLVDKVIMRQEYLDDETGTNKKKDVPIGDLFFFLLY
jgi:hypothetical protein